MFNKKVLQRVYTLQILELDGLEKVSSMVGLQSINCCDQRDQHGREGEREILGRVKQTFQAKRTIHLGSKVTLLSSFGYLYTFQIYSQSILDVG